MDHPYPALPPGPIRYEPYRALLDNMKPLNSGVYALADYFDRT
jgi:hypothetical protein